MITSEFTTPVSTVRIHDDCLDSVATNSMARASQIVSDSYKRRLQADREGPVNSPGPLPVTGRG